MSLEPLEPGGNWSPTDTSDQIHVHGHVREWSDWDDGGWLLFEPPEWHKDAACKGMGTEMFYPEQGTDSRPAKKVCQSCPVRAECLEEALSTGEKFGTWGGASEKQRRLLRRGQRQGRPPAECGSEAGYSRHCRRKENACQPCLVAHRAYVKVQYARNRTTTYGDRAREKDGRFAAAATGLQSRWWQ